MNKIILMGRLTRDAETRNYTGGTLCKFGLAVNGRKDEVLFIDCTAFGKVGETISAHLAKGDPIIIEGRIQLEQWTSQEGEKRSRHSIIVESFTFVPRAREEERTF